MRIVNEKSKSDNRQVVMEGEGVRWRDKQPDGVDTGTDPDCPDGGRRGVARRGGGSCRGEVFRQFCPAVGTRHRVNLPWETEGVDRWVASALLEIEPSLNKLNGYRHLQELREVMKGFLATSA